MTTSNSSLKLLSSRCCKCITTPKLRIYPAILLALLLRPTPQERGKVARISVSHLLDTSLYDLRPDLIALWGDFTDLIHPSNTVSIILTTLLTMSYDIMNFTMIFLYEYKPTVLTIPTAYCMETEFWQRMVLGLGLAWLCAEKTISGIRHSDYHVMFESIAEAKKM